MKKYTLWLKNMPVFTGALVDCWCELQRIAGPGGRVTELILMGFVIRSGWPQ